MIETEILVVGGGPAGLMAAIASSSLGAQVTLIDRQDKLGGQLIKQTHKFFGSFKAQAGVRGIDIAKNLMEEIKLSENKIMVITNGEVVGFYPDGTVIYSHKQKIEKIKYQKVILATGASERMLLFPGNDLPGVYAAGAIQTLMNVYGVLPGKEFLMVGAGNIGLIVSYQLLQAGAKISAVIDIMPKIGGYLVHASKIRRMGVPIYMNHTIVQAKGLGKVEEAVIAEVDDNFLPISKTEKTLKVDVISLAVGLSPLGELLEQTGVEFTYIPELGGFVPFHDEFMKTSRDDIFVAGDLAGIEEATTAMLQGKLAGLVAAVELGYKKENIIEEIDDIKNKLAIFRSGPKSLKIRKGLKIMENQWVKSKGIKVNC